MTTDEYRALLRSETRATTSVLVLLIVVLGAQTAILVTSWHTPWMWVHLVAVLALCAVLPSVWTQRTHLITALEDLHDA
jgi:hypothetical protein